MAPCFLLTHACTGSGLRWGYVCPLRSQIPQRRSCVNCEALKQFLMQLCWELTHSLLGCPCPSLPPVSPALTCTCWTSVSRSHWAMMGASGKTSYSLSPSSL